MKSWDGAVGLGSEMSFVRLLISILHIHECPVDSERDRGSISSVFVPSSPECV